MASAEPGGITGERSVAERMSPYRPRHERVPGRRERTLEPLRPDVNLQSPGWSLRVPEVLLARLIGPLRSGPVTIARWLPDSRGWA